MLCGPAELVHIHCCMFRGTNTQNYTEGLENTCGHMVISEMALKRC